MVDRRSFWAWCMEPRLATDLRTRQPRRQRHVPHHVGLSVQTPGVAPLERGRRPPGQRSGPARRPPLYTAEEALQASLSDPQQRTRPSSVPVDNPHATTVRCCARSPRSAPPWRAARSSVVRHDDVRESDQGGSPLRAVTGALIHPGSTRPGPLPERREQDGVLPMPPVPAGADTTSAKPRSARHG